MNKLARTNRPSRIVFGLRFLLSCAALGLSASAFAVCTPTSTTTCLADQPIQSTTVVKPNVMFILDNSGSMAWDYMPDSHSSNNNCRKNYQYNTIYYNPNFNYTAAVPKDAFNVSMGSQSFTAAQTDPFTSTTTRDLSSQFCSQGGLDSTCSTGSASTSTNKQAAFYYKYTGAGSPGNSCASNASYTKVIVGANSCQIGGDVTSCPTGADERENFANWFSYYRIRRLMMKSGMASAFSTIDDKMRVGFYTINSPNDSTFTNGAAQKIDDFSGGAAGTPKGDWYAKLFKVQGNSSTPLQVALNNIGRYYSGSPPSGLSGDPVQYSCQKNFTILSTDGGWNGPDTNKDDWDLTVPSSMPSKPGLTYDPADTGLTVNAQFPKPYYEGTNPSDDTLADIAMYYWVRDLRTTGTVAPNNVFTSSADPAYWQHMNLFTIGLGVTGTLNPASDWCALQEPTNLPSDCLGYTGPWKNWPSTPDGGNTSTTDPSKFDDLWHAAVNGRGQYYAATNPESLSTGLAAALKSIYDLPTYSGPTSSTSDFKSPHLDDYTTFESSYRVINWSGDVKKFNLDRATGLKTGSALWSAAKRLDQKVNPGLTATLDPTGHTNRNIVTRNELGVGVEFAYTASPSSTTLSAAQLEALCYKVTPGTGPCVAGDSSLIDFLRGEGKWEGTYAVGTSRFRDRHDAGETGYFKRDLLGSIVNSQPAYVAEEQEVYQDTGYAEFKIASKTRAPTLYVGANDGMVHALDAATGDELWAYVPSFIIPTGTDEDGREKGMRALSYQDSGAPAYNPHYYVDGPLEAGAVDFNRTGGPGPLVTTVPPAAPPEEWRNILVGGLGKGGKGYFALDVTEPATTLSAAKSKVLWEFPSASDSSHNDVVTNGLMGYSYGRPIIAKTHAWGWVVMLPSGYNNADGYGYVFVLNAKTGELLETLKTPITAPGMAHLTFLAKSNNKYVRQVYSGDLNGNLWRFDFGLPVLSPRVAQIFSSSSSTPITTEVNVSVDGNDGKRWVFFGTGKYLEVNDRANTDPQQLVALRDGTVDIPKSFVSPVALATLPAVTDLLVGVPSAPDGWRYVLPDSGEREALKPVADLRTVIYGSLIPTSDPCSPGISGNAYALEYSTGKTRFIDADDNPLPYLPLSSGISSMEIVATGKTPDSSGAIKGKVCDTTGNCTAVKLDTSKLYSGTRHVGWREMLNE